MIPFDPGDIWSYTNDPDATPPSSPARGTLGGDIAVKVAIGLSVVLWFAAGCVMVL